jgi:Ca-activated chloride channel family protein
MSFAWPVLLWGLLLVPVTLGVYVAVQRRRRRDISSFANWDLLPNLVPKAPGWRRHVPVGLYLMALSGLLLALARPHAVMAVPRERATVVLVMDTSISMGATDVQPTRLAAAIAAAKRFLDRVPPQLRVAVVRFSNGAEILSAPSTDRFEARQALDSLRVEGGTAMGDAIDAALGLIQSTLDPATSTPGSTPTAGSAPPAPPAAILLLSDGASTAGQAQPLDAAARARQLGIPVFTIALGTAAGTIEAPDGSGQRIAAAPDEATLRQIATQTRAQFFSAPTAADLQAVYQNLGSRVGYVEEPQEVTATFAGASAALLVAGGLLALVWFNRFP